MDSQERKHPLLLVIFAVILIILVFAYSLFDSPKFNPIKTELLTSSTAATAAENEGQVNINTADISELCELEGIGEKKAVLIIEYRETNGKFRSIDELLSINGISQNTLDDNAGRITV